MVDRDLEAKSRLVALARKKAEQRGTTLEREVQCWLARYVNEPAEQAAQQQNDEQLSRWSAPKATITKAVGSINKAKAAKPPTKLGSSRRAGGDTRSEAYRRLLGVIGDSSKEPS